MTVPGAGFSFGLSGGTCESSPRNNQRGHLFMNEYYNKNKEKWKKYYQNRINKINKLCPTCGSQITNTKSNTCQKHFSDEARSNIGKGHVGLKMSTRAKEKCRITKLGQLNPNWMKRGELSPSWKGGCRGNYDFYYQTDWDILRKRIYERDRWTCQRCGKHCGRKTIQCHHKVPYFVSKDNSDDNLTTLCVSCHTTIDNEYRKLHPVRQGKLF